MPSSTPSLPPTRSRASSRRRRVMSFLSRNSGSGGARAWLARGEGEADRRFQGGARCMQGDRPRLVSYDSVRRNAAPGLERLHGSLGVWTEIAVDALRGDVPRAGSAIGQQSLQRPNDLARGALLQNRHGSAIGQRIPGQGTDNTVDRETGAILKIPHSRLKL